MRSWPHTVATIIGHTAGRGADFGGDDAVSGPRQFRAVFQYHGPAGEVLQGRADRATYARPDVGAELPVCVNPANPMEVYPVERTSRVTLGVTFGVMAAFAIGSFFFVRLLIGS